MLEIETTTPTANVTPVDTVEQPVNSAEPAAVYVTEMRGADCDAAMSNVPLGGNPTLLTTFSANDPLVTTDTETVVVIPERMTNPPAGVVIKLGIAMLVIGVAGKIPMANAAQFAAG
jgi:hypothetical protein